MRQTTTAPRVDTPPPSDAGPQGFTAADGAGDDIAAIALAGLTATPKCLPPRLFYDAAGSRLFDRITGLAAYYPTRTESRILHMQAAEIATRAGRGTTLVEFGSGASVKTRLVLDALRDPAAYVPIDISAEHMMTASAALARDHPGLAVRPVHGDFMQMTTLPLDDAPAGTAGRRLGFFPGSTIGNLLPDEAVCFLRRAACMLGHDGHLLVGVDLEKDPARLIAAYDDPDGVTAAFNLNLLTRLNREAAADFRLDRFAHRAIWRADAGRIEMHLESLTDQIVQVAGRGIRFRKGETIHTENSHKYTPTGFARLVRRGGWRTDACWTDPERLFSLHYLIQNH
ncbi:dimethylhistidine N-methyltransferase [Tistrella bauzanensis]|uniref:Dimethylhistidine N-methyltransferase n=1 Tax=Tistrella bauzanensis TaxID=657419 RepID=A0ABQ1IA02_9PROT|nr:L-histidine N(alpha)-methyltransferase [Tistrella bauzanensis]GGB28206.1 dimethylhistidine N-methyltransferase [Tistrella bauzanensis]